MGAILACISARNGGARPSRPSPRSAIAGCRQFLKYDIPYLGRVHDVTPDGVDAFAQEGPQTRCHGRVKEARGHDGLADGVDLRGKRFKLSDGATDPLELADMPSWNGRELPSSLHLDVGTVEAVQKPLEAVAHHFGAFGDLRQAVKVRGCRAVRIALARDRLGELRVGVIHNSVSSGLIDGRHMRPVAIGELVRDLVASIQPQDDEGCEAKPKGEQGDNAGLIHPPSAGQVSITERVGSRLTAAREPGAGTRGNRRIKSVCMTGVRAM